MQNRKRDTDVQNRVLDSVGEGKGGMFQENSIRCFCPHPQPAFNKITCWAKKKKRTASKHVYYLGWNRSPSQAGCMRQVLRPDALGRPRGIRWRGKWEGGSGWGIHVNPWPIHVNVWQKPLQYCKVISLQLIKINEKKKKKVIPLCRKNKIN